MVLGNELNESLSESPFTLSPEQIAQAHHKSKELDKSLGFDDTSTFENFDCLDEDESLNPTKSVRSPTDGGNVKGKEIQFEIEVECPEQSTKESLAQQQFRENEEFIASIAAEVEYERSVGEGNKSEEPPSSPEVQLILPREMARELRKGGYKLILEPISGRTGDEPFGFDVKAVPIDPAPQINSECASDQPTTTCTDPSSDVKCDTDNNSASDAEGTGSESDNLSSKAKKSGLGSAHRGGKIK